MLIAQVGNKYVYCANNPVMYSDPSGNKVDLSPDPRQIAIDDGGSAPEGESNDGGCNNTPNHPPLPGGGNDGDEPTPDAIDFDEGESSSPSDSQIVTNESGVEDVLMAAMDMVLPLIDKITDFILNDDEQAVIDADYFAFYKGVLYVKVPSMDTSGFSFGIVYVGNEISETLVRHEYGHSLHLSQIGLTSYVSTVLIPSVVTYHTGLNDMLGIDYYSLPWEYIAEMLGETNRADYSYEDFAEIVAEYYYLYTYLFSFS